SQPSLLFSFPAGLHHSSPSPPLPFSTAAAPSFLYHRCPGCSREIQIRRGERQHGQSTRSPARPQASTRRCGSKPYLPLCPVCTMAGPPAQRHMFASGDTTRRGGEGGDGAAAGARSSAWSWEGAAAQAYPLGREATKPGSACGGHWDATRRIQPTVAASAARAPWPSSTASPVSQQTHSISACRLYSPTD
ncbi:unnamed protein product, partial [Urochloa humidicola]